jgi:hypothetical protein
MHEHHEVLEARYANLADENVKRLANWPATVRCRYERDLKAPSVKGEACKLTEEPCRASHTLSQGWARRGDRRK